MRVQIQGCQIERTGQRRKSAALPFYSLHHHMQYPASSRPVQFEKER